MPRALIAPFFLLLAALSGRAEDLVLLPADVQMKLVAKVWSLDRSLVVRRPGAVAILYQGRNRESMRTRDEILRAARSHGGLIVKAIDLEEEPLTRDALAGMDVAYITPIRSQRLDDLLAVTRAAQVRTITGVSAYVSEGVAVGLSVEQGRPAVLVNLPAARAEGSDFSSQLLKVARVIEQ